MCGLQFLLGQTALYVYGDMRVTGDLNLDDLNANGDLDVNGHTELDNLNVSGVSTFVGFTTFNDYVFIQDGLNVTGAGITATNVNVSGIVTATSFDGKTGPTITNILYVTTDGDDTNTGRAVDNAKRTVGSALTIAEAFHSY